MSGGVAASNGGGVKRKMCDISELLSKVEAVQLVHRIVGMSLSLAALNVF